MVRQHNYFHHNVDSDAISHTINSTWNCDRQKKIAAIKAYELNFVELFVN